MAALAITTNDSVSPVTIAGLQNFPRSVSSESNIPSGRTPLNWRSTPVLEPGMPARPAQTSTSQVLGRVLQLHEGAFKFDLQEVPMLGASDAPHAMVSLFDYSCRHCRVMHSHLKALHRTYSNQLAILSLVVPLNTNCNHTITRVHPDHVDACEYARIGLAVWRADRRKLEQFDDWIFTPARPPAPAIVRSYAAQLVGSNALEQALRDAWVSRQLEQSGNLLATNYQRYRRGALPQLMIGTNVVAGELRGPHDLYPLVAANLGLTNPVVPTPSLP